MNIWENAVITTNGLFLLAKLTEGHTLDITRAESGSGYVTPGLLNQQTAITDPKQELTFQAVSYPEEGKCKLPCYLLNDDLDTGYVATQVGIYATDPDEGEILFFIAQAASGKGTEIPSSTEMPGYSAEWNFYFQYGMADGVTVTVDPSDTATKADLEAHASDTTKHVTEDERAAWNDKASKNHTHTKKEVGLGNVDNTSDEEKPLSTAAKNALNLKANISLDNVDSDTIKAKLDELKWSSATMSNSAAWCSVAYGNGMFVAIDANSAAASYSKDGINWTGVELPESVDCGDIAYGNGKFVVIGRSQSFAYSYDGISWQSATISILANWDHIAYGNGKFIVVAYNSAQVAYSTDGITWATSSLPVKAYWTGVAYGGGRYVAISNSSGTAAYSDDGISWTQSALPSIESADWESITYGNGKFVAILYSSDIVAYSTDGITWATSTLPVRKFWKEVAYGNGKFVAIASSADVYVYSSDGISWSSLPLSVDNEPWNTIAYGNGKFVVVAQDSDVVLHASVQFASAVGAEDALENLGVAYIETFSYVGTGISDEEQTTTITIKPNTKIIVLFNDVYGSQGTIIARGQQGYCSPDSAYKGWVREWTDTEVTLYANYKSPFNDVGYTYTYMLING